MIMPKYNLVSLFSGAGGFDFGFEVTGRWQTLIATDIHPVMCETLRRNQGVALPNGGQYLKDASILEGDIQHTDIPGHLGGTQVDLVLGGPPCQSFSVMGKHGGYRDERGSLIYEFADIVQKLVDQRSPFVPVSAVLPHHGKTLAGGATQNQINLRTS